MQRTDDAVAADFMLDDALAIAFGPDSLKRPPSKLAEHQRLVLRAMADVRFIWEKPNLFASTLINYHLPKSRDELIAFLETPR